MTTTPIRSSAVLLGGKLEAADSSARRRSAPAMTISRDYADRAGAKAIVLPTVVDIDQYVPAATRPERPLTIGWIGSPSTWAFVRPLLPLLAELCRDRGVALRRGRGRGRGRGRPVRRPDLRAMERGQRDRLGPGDGHRHHAAARRALGARARAATNWSSIWPAACPSSPRRSGSMRPSSTTAGLACSQPMSISGASALIRLIDDPALRAAMGQAGRRRAVEAYSLQAHAPRLIEAMRDAVG